jgi:hypothetical protein
MHRWSTALVVVAVAALAVFAAADALRGNDEPKAPAASPTTTRPKPPTLRETLRGQGVSGQILYSDQDCIIHSLVLPQMVDEVVAARRARALSTPAGSESEAAVFVTTTSW